MKKNTRSARIVAAILALSLLAAACGGSDDDVVESEPEAAQSDATDAEAAEEESPEPVEVSEEDADAPTIGFADEGCPTLTLETYDSFAVSEGLFKTFTDETCIEVQQVAAGDAGQLVSASILTKDNPTADVMFGIDNTFLQRGLDADLFLPYESALLSSVDPVLQLDPEFRVTPMDYSDVCVNYWFDALPGDVPETLDDLIDPVNAGQFVTENPETSSPGFAFLLATIAAYGEDGWEDYWSALVDNGLAVTPGWSEAYYGDFIVGGGDRSMVTSYASSPPAEVIYADPPVDTAPSGVLFDSCFRQVEFAGILAGTEFPSSSQQLIDFMLSAEFQEDIPLNMFVYPANGNAELPAEFVEYGVLADDPATLEPSQIEANRQDWIERWTEIVLG